MLATRGVVVLVLALVAGCRDDGRRVLDDGGVGFDGPPWMGCPCAQPPPSGSACGGALCGNGEIDQCWIQSPMGCHCISFIDEPCDGNTQDCTGYGYYGGAAVCNASCSGFDYRTCDACPPNSRCATFAELGVFTGATSGSFVAAAAWNGVAIFDGLTRVADVPISSVWNLVALPAGGWLVIADSPFTLSTLDTAGVRGTPHALPSTVTGTRMAVAGDRVLIAYTTQLIGQWRVEYVIADTSGNIVVPAATLFTGASQYVEVTSDGTSFFVASDGHLARVAQNGTSTVVDGFPLAQGMPLPLWSGSTGWYVVPGAGTSFVAQRFDSNGAKVGTAITFDVGAFTAKFVADGTDLVVARFTSAKRVALARIDPTGAVGLDVEVGGGEGNLGYLGRRGSDFVVLWNRAGHFQLALAAP